MLTDFFKRDDFVCKSFVASDDFAEIQMEWNDAKTEPEKPPGLSYHTCSFRLNAKRDYQIESFRGTWGTKPTLDFTRTVEAWEQSGQFSIPSLVAIKEMVDMRGEVRDASGRVFNIGDISENFARMTISISDGVVDDDEFTLKRFGLTEVQSSSIPWKYIVFAALVVLALGTVWLRQRR